MQMTEPDSGSFHTVTDPEQARLLTEPVSKEFFKPFLAHERSASQAATIMRCNLNTVLYRIKTLLRAGLIKVVREMPRKGRPVRVYRSVHDAYFVPFSVTPYATLEERLEVQAEPSSRDLSRLTLRRSGKTSVTVITSLSVWTVRCGRATCCLG